VGMIVKHILVPIQDRKTSNHEAISFCLVYY
jgi:hypothetical protein